MGPAAWGVPVFVAGEFLRVVTHPRLFDRPSKLEDALAALDGLLSSGTARLLLPGERYWSILRETALDGRASGNLLFDAQIAAVCIEHGVTTIMTEDRDFRRFSRMQVLPLV